MSVAPVTREVKEFQIVMWCLTRLKVLQALQGNCVEVAMKRGELSKNRVALRNERVN